MYDEGQNARERARSHSARTAILALLAKDDRELTAPEIRAELPGGLTLRNIYYHLSILETTHLIVRDGDSYRLS
jgi:predicted transcriptional regulator